jgi:hypothetical protein
MLTRDIGKVAHFCPVCRAPTKSTLKDSLPLGIHIRVFSLTTFFVGLGYFFFEIEGAIKASVSYLPLWAISEFLHWAQMRERTKCRACGFDPILYRKDWRKARSLVEKNLQGVVDKLLNEQLKTQKTIQNEQKKKNDATVLKPSNKQAPENRP